MTTWPRGNSLTAQLAASHGPELGLLAGSRGPWKGGMSWGKGSEVCADNSFSLETDGDLIQEGCLEVPVIFVGNLVEQSF